MVSTPTTPNVELAVERLRGTKLSRNRQAFVARAVRAVTDLALDVDERALIDATGAPSDYDTLLQALNQTVARDKLVDPLGPARLRGIIQREQMLAAEGGVLGVGDVARALGITRQAVEKRRRAGQLIGLRTGRRGYAYPAWQFDSREGVLPGLPSVLKLLHGFDPWMQVAFMLGNDLYLDGESPLAALREGRIAEVERAARAFGEHGAA